MGLLEYSVLRILYASQFIKDFSSFFIVGQNGKKRWDHIMSTYFYCYWCSYFCQGGT